MINNTMDGYNRIYSGIATESIFSSIKNRIAKKSTSPIDKSNSTKKYTLADIGIDKWIIANHNKLSSQYDGSKGEWLLTNIGDATRNEVLNYIASALKQEAWRNSFPLMIFPLVNNGKPRGTIAAYTFTFESMATEGIISAGYVTIKFITGSLEGIIDQTSPEIKVALWYHEVWNIEKPDALAPKQQFAITEITWKMK